MRKFAMVSVLCCLTTVTSYAATPVIDYRAIIHMSTMIDELKDQYDQMVLTYDEIYDQTGILTDHLAALQGKYNFSDLYDTVADQEYRSWAPDTLIDFEDMLSHGFNPGDLKDRYEYYQQKFEPIDSAKIDAKNPNSAQRDLYEYHEEWTKLNLSSFAQTFDAVNGSFAKINNLLAKVDTLNTMKESTDFNNRLMGEVAYLMQNMVQIQNFDLHIKTMLQQSELTHMAEHSRFFTFKKK